MTISIQKEQTSAVLTISFYKKQHLLRVGVSDVIRHLDHFCDQRDYHLERKEGNVTIQRLACDQKKKRIHVSISVRTKDGLADKREMMFDWQSREIVKWTIAK
ncbi:competence type IV pilus minor pilin ComGG [Bacillus sp. Bos-x628]|uniref:competence type IV pilus minor pilin ComGG n=1 Tax=Bacillus maqinnsis TaxID=3229854 RepID=UPI00338F8745